MKKRILSIIVLILSVISFSGCGKTKIDVMEYITLNYDGANGYGTANIENAYGWEAEALEAAGIEEIDSFSTLAEAFVIESSVTYEVTPNKNLSNGDEVTVNAIVNDETIEEYNIRLLGGEKKFIVEGLPEIEEVDLFENVDIIFSGIAPYVTASISNANTDYYIYPPYTYSLDKSDNLNIGDIIKVTVSYDEEALLKAGYIAESDTKEFEVLDVTRYAAALSDIPTKTIEELKKETEDIIKSNIAKLEGYSVDNMEFLGNYFLNEKINMTGNKNCCYCVYKVDLTGKAEHSYYYYVGYYDILILEDGECSYDLTDNTKPNNNIFWGWDRLNGYEDLDNLFNFCVTRNLEYYTYESTVAE